MTLEQTLNTLETDLNSFAPQTRAAALAELNRLAEQGQISLPAPADVFNMHCHTFFSFNGYGHSPASLAWQGKRRGFKLMGIVDFDVLDGVEEFLNACELIGLRGSAGLETRVFIPEFADKEINSPGEPGVYYHMGIGFTGGTAPEAVAAIPAGLRRRAESRNRDMLARINAHLQPVSLDYDRDVLPLTPNGNATERHILAAYLSAAQKTVTDPVAFWAAKLGLPVEQVAAAIADTPKFSNVVRAKLMKQGGVGYIQPGPTTFPSVEELHRFVIACGAIPCATWLDGTSPGEQAMPELLNLLIGKGVAALNIVPDRNWNIADPAAKRLKLQKLYDVVKLADQLDLPLNIGTEMNAFGLKWVDDLDGPELAPVKQAFSEGAFFVYGHTVAQKTLGRGYQSDWAAEHLPTRRQKNAFYTQLGRQVPPGPVDPTDLEKLMKVNV